MSELCSEKDAITASQIWGILIWAAKNQQTLTYKDLSLLVGRFWRDLRFPLGAIKDYCENNNLPALTVLVVEGDTQKPSFNFDKVQDIDKERGKVFLKVAEVYCEFKKYDSECPIINPGVEFFKQYKCD